MIDIDAWLIPNTVYACPVCGTTFEEYDECQAHVKFHSRPEKILSYSNKASDTNCPDCIIVKLSDGREAEYALIAVLDKKSELELNIESPQVPIITSDQKCPF